MDQLRLNKFLAERLGISRREADEAIRAGKVTVNGEPALLGARVLLSENQRKNSLTHLPSNKKNHNITGLDIDKNDEVCYNGKIVPLNAEFLYLKFNKPTGYVCSRRAQGQNPTLYDLLPKKYHSLKTVGRLDKDSSGLILLTNDGDFAFKMTHPKFRKNKIYEVELDKPLEPLHQQMITDFGVEIGDGLSRFKIIKDGAIDLSNSSNPRACSPLRSSQRQNEPHTKTGGRVGSRVDELLKSMPVEKYIVILSEGRNRQIRRTFAALGYEVTKLHRIQFGPYELGNLKSGEYAIIKL